MQTKLSFAEVTKPVYYFQTVAATNDFNSSVKWRKCLEIFQSITYTTIYVALIYSISSNTVFLFSIPHTSVIVSVITSISLLISDWMTIYGFTLKYFFKKTVARTNKTIDDVDELLSKQGMGIGMIDANNNIRKLTIYGIVIVSLYLLFLITPSVFLDEFEGLRLLRFVAFQIVTLSILFQYWSWCTILRSRFKLINNSLVTYDVDDGFINYLEWLIDLHKKLIELAKSINHCFNIILLFFTSFILITLTTQGYIIVYTVIVKYPIKQIKEVVLTLEYVLYDVIRFVIVLYGTEGMCLEANSTIRLLHGVIVEPENVHLRNRIISKSLMLMNNKLEIIVCKLFHFNRSLFYSMCATVAMNLVIMIQFDVDSAKRTTVLNPFNKTTNGTN
ncbi:hypothetical protein FQR65_LT07055 [Abscondita terminalis]|nr:hypothetical protein FQR65_LT07055 [Abscondita terminalis]